MNLLTYLNRWDEPGAPDRLARAIGAESDANMLVYLVANASYSKAIDDIVKTRLNAGEPRTAQEAASRVGEGEKQGSPLGQAVDRG